MVLNLSQNEIWYCVLMKGYFIIFLNIFFERKGYTEGGTERDLPLDGLLLI